MKVLVFTHICDCPWKGSSPQGNSAQSVLQKVPISPLPGKGTLDNCTCRISPSVKTNFTVSLQILLIASSLHWISLQSLCPHLPASLFPSPPWGKPASPSTTCVASTLFRQAKWCAEQRGSHTFLLLPKPGASERALPVLGKWHNYVQYLISTLAVNSSHLHKWHKAASSLAVAPDHSL